MHVAPLDTGPCLDRVRQGDEIAARDLVAHLHPLVMKIVRAHLPVRLAEEDLAQEVYTRIFERLDRYEARTGVPFEHWVSRLAVRTCLDALRAERRRPELREADLPAGSGEEQWLDYLVDRSGTAPESAPGEARELVERLLRRLSTDDRLVVSLLDLEERSVAEVAGLTGWSAVGVRVRAFRARNRLRRVARELRAEEDL